MLAKVRANKFSQLNYRMSELEKSQYVKRRIKFDSVDVHPIEKALVVFYRIEAILLSQEGEAVAGEKRESQKLIKVQSLNSSTDVNGLAKEVIHQCKLIPSSRVNEVQQLLSYLQQRPDKPQNEKKNEKKNEKYEDISDILCQTDEKASMGKIESYIELLYEEVEKKITGTTLILQLAKNHENLQDLSQNEALIGVLYRVLREDGRRHFALAINITFIFFYLASYSTFHQVLTRFKVGSLLMEIIRWELQRFEQWDSELKSGHYEEDGLLRKIQTALLQQTMLIRTSCYILLHLSEDPSVEDKMRKKGMVQLLVKTLQRKHEHSSVNELNYLVLTFLQKLSIFAENKDEMTQLGLIERAAVLINSPSRLVQDAAARVLYNLSFDATLRLRIGRLGLVPSLIKMMVADSNNWQGESIAWALVYQISLDDRGRILISRSECFSLVLEYLLRCQQTPLPLVPLALAINLALNLKLATELSESKYFQLFLDTAVKNQDAVLIKLLRNATGHAHSSTVSPVAMDKIVQAIYHSSDNYFQSEALGLLANLGERCSPVDWNSLIDKQPLLSWIADHLQTGTPFDVQLSAILVLSCIASVPEAAERLLEHQLPPILLNLLRSQQEDDEFVLQILYVFNGLLLHKETRSTILSKYEDIAASFLDLMTDQNVQVRKVCERGLFLIAESDAKWQDRIKNERFCWHNAQWLEAIAKTNLLSSAGAEDMQSASSMLGLCVRHADLHLDRASNSASSFETPESRIGSPEGSEAWESNTFNAI